MTPSSLGSSGSPLSSLSASDKALRWYITAVQQIGFPIIVAAVLLWIMLKDVPGNAAAASRDAALARTQLAEHMHESRAALDRVALQHAEESIRLGRIMQQICVNTATTAQERDRCFPE